MLTTPPGIPIVDDEQAIAELLAEVLTDAGYRVRIAYSGMDALGAEATTERVIRRYAR